MMMKLHCAIKKHYLEMILNGSKKVEYRDMSEYWCGKILDMSKYSGSIQEVCTKIQNEEVALHVKPYDIIVFHCDNETVSYRIEDIKTYRGHKIFAIYLGNRVK